MVTVKPYTARLIDDLIPLILDSNDHWWPRDFLRLATVSPSWLFYVRKRLYAFPTIYTFPACALLARTLSANPSLIPLISGLNLRPMVMLDDCSQKLDMSGLHHLLALDLRRLTFGGRLSLNAARFLSLLSNPYAVNDLHIDGSLLADSLCSRPSVEWDESMTFRFPNLKRLQLTHLDLDIIPSISCPLPASQLVLEDVDITGGFICQMTNGASIDFLHVLTKRAEEFDEQIRLVLDSCRVGCLEYEVRGEVPSTRFIIDAASPNYPFLHGLHLRGLQVDVGTLIGIEARCQNLVELTVCGRMVRVTAKEWSELISCGSFGSLKRLGLPGGTNSPPFVTWPSAAARGIHDACASRNMRLLVC
ncbi:hypothetical protein K443DRAFT_676036 [Laccaria amethystina LaAM-08-1]|uniref:F-box domain-containing protein n=1 Tax=Laccaria amethystina LaAM-08-1 TaxID=1095629 RepID=A0A0C9WX23_9AGAR|nr:hypothetical protein K443DRAFT_676036 [Laccaria amethystina LaAM-08-1]